MKSVFIFLFRWLQKAFFFYGYHGIPLCATDAAPSISSLKNIKSFDWNLNKLLFIFNLFRCDFSAFFTQRRDLDSCGSQYNSKRLIQLIKGFGFRELIVLWIGECLSLVWWLWWRVEDFVKYFVIRLSVFASLENHQVMFLSPFSLFETVMRIIFSAWSRFCWSEGDFLQIGHDELLLLLCEFGLFWFRSRPGSRKFQFWYVNHRWVET